MSPTNAGTYQWCPFDTFTNVTEFELCDLDHDPIQFHNLAGEPGLKDVAERLQHRFPNPGARRTDHSSIVP
ncbi:MAG TPA: hypothetical protein DCY13_16640 [Verrucomicrobiales bacterium]|nr:hypothetical protein [Verrucomicrobiales bacterium]